MGERGGGRELFGSREGARGTGRSQGLGGRGGAAGAEEKRAAAVFSRESLGRELFGGEQARKRLEVLGGPRKTFGLSEACLVGWGVENLGASWQQQ